MHCCHSHSNGKKRCLKLLLLALVGIAALAGITLLLWNWLLPNLFTGAQTINFWQALGILVLSKILFGGWPCRGWHGHHHHSEPMTPEEKAHLKAQFKSRWSHWCCADNTEKTHTDELHGN
jgi:hypothetical protein